MDVAYRLCPEIDIYGMVGDAKRAVAWMKANADRYEVKPEKIVIGGSSAEAHIALLAGYNPEHNEFKLQELIGADLSVCGIISYYGPTDLLAAYQHENQQLFEDIPPVPIGKKLDFNNRLNLDFEIMPNYAGRLDILLGGLPQDTHGTYKLASPITHVHSGSPPTLLIQVKQDLITSVDATCELHKKLVDSGVPAVNLVFPWTDHAFDLMLPQISPPAQSALYDVVRFLALTTNHA